MPDTELTVDLEVEVEVDSEELEVELDDRRGFEAELDAGGLLVEIEAEVERREDSGEES